ncbi:uncharacterized protein KY384_006320 [Bacidia gigantensis]|uniref:uncharacterized protein n=1 Tax=Bacidia gigantensis TaxID=2732470 RepID=UPI001D051A60|nr:uncharacterized protein KY384_006320 [Bacidia gigantensis]KAG8528633.1 hypothetical protein KY384_006320 [Bacidia gigantensis]
MQSTSTFVIQGTSTSRTNFLDLPRELRDEVYFWAFDTLPKNRTVQPSLNKRPYLGPFGPAGPIANVNPLLRSCRQIHDEATLLLYSKHKFYFDDTHHGVATMKVRLSEFGEKSLCHRDKYDSHIQCTQSKAKRYHKKGDFVRMPKCDITTLNKWLQTIGTRNRLMIRNIELSLSGARFTHFRGGKDNITYDLGRQWMNGSSYHTALGGHLLESAFHLLARGHGLQTLTVTFAGPELGYSDPNDYTRPYERAANRTEALVYAFKDFFHPSSRMRWALNSIKGVEKFTFHVPEGVFEDFAGLAVDLQPWKEAWQGVMKVTNSIEQQAMAISGTSLADRTGIQTVIIKTLPDLAVKYRRRQTM